MRGERIENGETAFVLLWPLDPIYDAGEEYDRLASKSWKGRYLRGIYDSFKLEGETRETTKKELADLFDFEIIREILEDLGRSESIGRTKLQFPAASF